MDVASKLNFSDCSDISMDDDSYPQHCSSPTKSVTPKVVGKLKLFSSPTTPVTMMCAADSTSEFVIRNKKLPHSRFRNSHPLRDISPISIKVSRKSNINPFCAKSLLMSKKKKRFKESFETSGPSPKDSSTCSFNKSIDSSFDTEENELPVAEGISIHEANVSRYCEEFYELGVIGKGQFGCVYKCKHRLDGLTYAVKKSLKPIAGSANERKALNEVYAHAVLGKHPHVVRYYSAWAELDHMLIQNEFCNRGSLSSLISNKRKDGKVIPEDQLKQIMLHIARGLKYIHSQHLVHMDIKPDNIFIVEEPRIGDNDSADDGFDEDDEEEELHYKIGDLGHVTSLLNPVVEEGDCRYLPKELLQEDYAALTKVDIFALGVTIYEAATGIVIPMNGNEWHNIRNGNLKDIRLVGEDLQEILKMMISNDPRERPTASQIIQNLTTNVFTKSQDHLIRELQKKNELLSNQLDEAVKCLRSRHSSRSALTAAVSRGVLAGTSRSTRLRRTRNGHLTK